MFIHANFSIIHHEAIHRSPPKHFHSSPSPVRRNCRFRKGRKLGFGGSRNDEARGSSTFGSSGSQGSSDGSGQMALTTVGRYPRIVNAYRKDVEHGYRGGMVGEARGEKPVVPVCEGGGETTVMIRNIPNKYTRELLIEFLDNHCGVANRDEVDEQEEGFVSAYDFIYLPLDLRKKLNLGYAFVNFTDPRAAWRFYKAANAKKWQLFQSKKISEIASARLQGKDRLVDHFENTVFACESEEFLPLTFSPARDGTNSSSVVRSTVGRIISPGRCLNRFPNIAREALA
ncbi:hypothetical protein MLD38_023018 [Melastoma candidum]|uniref:Uncharacterized protein n=1 Tax=Melastoma candidum TaxID=119954 RepID=A0ACB9QLC8_9MYRT|nr:hypothetical protein MLD38_023018 [Melastoma candidum]